jgi:hypothetical protein
VVAAVSTLALLGVALALAFSVGRSGDEKAQTPGETTSTLGAGTSDLSNIVNSITAPTPIDTTPSVTVSNPTKAPGPAVAPTPASGSKTGWTRGDQFGNKQVSDATTCYVNDADELTDAVYNQPCGTIFLTNGTREAYLLEDQLNITRPVTIRGHPMVLPQIDGAAAERCFWVQPGGKLTLMFLRIHQGGGLVRNRYIPLPNPNSRVAEIRGGAVFVDVGAEGLTAQGVMFLSIANTVNSVIAGWQNTLNMIGGRVYGGHVLAMGGVNGESLPPAAGSDPLWGGW